MSLQPEVTYSGSEAKSYPFTGGMKPTAGETLNIEAHISRDAESEVGIRTPSWGLNEARYLSRGRTGTAHNPTACE